MANALLSAERAAFLNDTQPEFGKWIAKGDSIQCGVDGDMIEAYPDGVLRPSGTVTKVKRFGEAGVSLRVRLDSNNQMIEIPVSTTDPGRVWQPTQKTFEHMQYRAMQAGMSSVADPAELGADDMGADDMGADGMGDPVYRGTHNDSIQEIEMALASLQTTLSALASQVSSMRQPAPRAAPRGAEWADPGFESDSSDGGAAAVGTFHFASDMSSDSEDGY